MDADLARTPVYLQLTERIRSAIREGRFAPGDQFWTERQLSGHFGVSRATANKALSGLVAEGLLEYRPGVGTFVAPTLEVDLASLISFTEKALSAGARPSTEVLEFRRTPAGRLPPAVAAALDLAPDATARTMVRLRRADGVPVILERRWLPDDLVPGMSRADAAGSLYALLRDRFGHRFGRTDETIRAVGLDDADARRLDVAPGAAALRVEALARTVDGRPLWCESTLYRGDRYEFRHTIGAASAPPPRGTLTPVGDAASEGGNP